MKRPDRNTVVKKAQVALFDGKHIISGECTYTARKFGSDVLIEIVMRKDGILKTKHSRTTS